MYLFSTSRSSFLPSRISLSNDHSPFFPSAVACSAATAPYVPMAVMPFFALFEASLVFFAVWRVFPSIVKEHPHL